MSSFSWRCQYCSWAFQMTSEAVAAALATADATQARHHVEHCPRCRKALKIPVDQLRHHAPISSPAASSAPIRSLSFKEDEKTMTDIPSPFPPVQPPAPPYTPPVPPVELPAPVIAPVTPVAPKPAAKKPTVKKPTVKKPAVKKPAARKPAKKKAVKRKPAKKAAKKPVKKVVKKAAKKSAKKKSRK